MRGGEGRGGEERRGGAEERILTYLLTHFTGLRQSINPVLYLSHQRSEDKTELAYLVFIFIHILTSFFPLIYNRKKKFIYYRL